MKPTMMGAMLLMMSSMSAVAEDIVITDEMWAEQRARAVEVCDDIGRVAAEIMKARQSGKVSMRELSDEINFPETHELIQESVIEGWKFPQLMTQDYKDYAIQEHRDVFTRKCLELLQL
ncbi:hypothetical protein [Aliiroseovarius sediminis]|uniref:hypothetical protein n=1 Tax=Aliiroseovarius sediminis TaxID=2925839 RepID=UPI001F5A883B|nr:hypothetical protein [Aliiroseovarius sediminis]MCI2394598.1 hypothetical protein [Aliiroseovarius sediminis]